MKRLRRSISVGAVLTLFVLGAPIDGAAADTHFQGGPPEQASAGLQRAAAAPVEPTGPPAHSAARGIVDCGEVITKNTTLLRDVGPCPGDGIIIGADNITLNLNGHTILGNADQGASGEFAGIRLPQRTGVTVTGHPGKSGKTGTVSGFEAGVVVNGGSANTLEKLLVQNNLGLPDTFTAQLGDGIAIFNSANNQIINNRIVNNGYFTGIAILGVGSNGNTVQNNVVEGTVATGTNVFGAEGFGIFINPAIEGPVPESIRDNDVIGNMVIGNGGTGIASISNLDALISGNTSNGNGFGTIGGTRSGIFVGYNDVAGATPVTRNEVLDNTVNDNSLTGIRIDTQENRIIGNEALGNGTDLYDANRYLPPREGGGVLPLPPPGGGGVLPLPPPDDGGDPEPGSTPADGADPEPEPPPGDGPVFTGPVFPGGPVFGPMPSGQPCDNNVWLNNIFETGRPDCVAGHNPSPAP